MRVVLMHNPTAGEEDHSARDLIEQLRHAGHDVVGEATRRKELTAALEIGCDVVAVAGGDGTVGKAAEVLARTAIPLAILPLGTANNIARHLGLAGETPELIAAWQRSVVRGFDRALLRRGEEALSFVEALGFGVFPEVIRTAQELHAIESRDEKLERALELFQGTLAQSRPSRYTVSADGHDLSGDYLLVEVMNIDSLGARVPIASASSTDGKLDLVLVGEGERQALARHLEDLREGRASDLRIASRQVSRVVITSKNVPHRDGRVLPGPPARNHFDVAVEPHALQVLVPE
jgi:diacylglycerol kinase (ATP)